MGLAISSLTAAVPDIITLIKLVRSLFTEFSGGPAAPNPTMSNINRNRRGGGRQPTDGSTNQPSSSSSTGLTLQDQEEIKQLREYAEDKFHAAIAGAAGAGKSTLVNAFRGLRNSTNRPSTSSGAVVAPAGGAAETTAQRGRYPDPNPARPIVWYDLPGGGTLDITGDGWEYFRTQGLYIFDFVVVLVDKRMLKLDLEILRHCEEYKVPCYIVRSNSDLYVLNVLQDLGYERSDTDPDHYSSAQEKFIADTRATVEKNLRQAGLKQQRVYIICAEAMRALICGEMPQAGTGARFIHEAELMKDILYDCKERRGFKRMEEELQQQQSTSGGSSSETRRRFVPPGGMTQAEVDRGVEFRTLFTL